MCESYIEKKQDDKLKNSGMGLPLGGREKDIIADFQRETFSNTGKVLYLKSGGEFMAIIFYTLHIINYVNVSNI